MKADRRVGFTVLAIIVIVVGLFWFNGREEPAKEIPKVPAQTTSSFKKIKAPEEPAATPHRFAEPGEIARNPVSPAPLANPADRSPLADRLNAPDQNAAQDLAIVLDLFEHYREMYRALPTAETNAQVVNALAGNNPRRVAFIERSNPAINVRGELTDRFGTPLFFHFISRDALEIRSAGADRELYTGDDEVKKSSALQSNQP